MKAQIKLNKRSIKKTICLLLLSFFSFFIFSTVNLFSSGLINTEFPQLRRITLNTLDDRKIIMSTEHNLHNELKEMAKKKSNI